jgi:hypothetical protein
LGAYQVHFLQAQAIFIKMGMRINKTGIYGFALCINHLAGQVFLFKVSALPTAMILPPLTTNASAVVNCYQPYKQPRFLPTVSALYSFCLQAAAKKQHGHSFFIQVM